MTEFGYCCNDSSSLFFEFGDSSSVDLRRGLASFCFEPFLHARHDSLDRFWRDQPLTQTVYKLRFQPVLTYQKGIAASAASAVTWAAVFYVSALSIASVDDHSRPAYTAFENAAEDIRTAALSSIHAAESLGTKLLLCSDLRVRGVPQVIRDDSPFGNPNSLPFGLGARLADLATSFWIALLGGAIPDVNTPILFVAKHFSDGRNARI